jgi:hypothetical protein
LNNWEKTIVDWEEIWINMNFVVYMKKAGIRETGKQRDEHGVI